MLTLLELSDVVGKPKVKLDLPGPLRIGDRVRLSFRLRRQNSGRSEVLEVFGEFRVQAMGLDFAQTAKRQVVSVTSSDDAPHWKAVKKQPEWRRTVPPAVSARKTIT